MAAGLRAARRRRPRLDVVGSPAAPKAGPRGAETGPGGELLPQPPARGCGHGRRKELPSSPAGGFGAGKASPAAAGAAPSARLLALSCSPSASTRRWGTEKPFPRARPARSRSRLRSASSENKRGKGKWWDPALCCISLLGCMAEGEEERGERCGKLDGHEESHADNKIHDMQPRSPLLWDCSLCYPV